MTGMTAVMQGTRLAFVVRKLDGDVTRERMEVKVIKGKGPKKTDRHELERVSAEEPAGYMVYFPRGHAIRCKDDRALARHGLNREPELVNLEGLHDPNSPAGKLFMSQDEQTRRGAFRDLERQVIDMVHRQGGSKLLSRGLEATVSNEG